MAQLPLFNREPPVQNIDNTFFFSFSFPFFNSLTFLWASPYLNLFLNLSKPQETKQLAGFRSQESV